tara:strand:+ start:868 stop:1155 length:288 start_codon:yes stop_codon:yes gene_type:complete
MTNDIHPPLGEKPEPDINLEAALDRLGATIKSLLEKMDKLQDNLNKLTAENKRLKDALGIVESPLVLTEEMEIKTPSTTTSISLKDLIKGGKNGH